MTKEHWDSADVKWRDKEQKVTEDWPRSGASPAARKKLTRRVLFCQNFVNNTISDISTRVLSLLSSLNQPALQKDTIHKGITKKVYVEL